MMPGSGEPYEDRDASRSQDELNDRPHYPAQAGPSTASVMPPGCASATSRPPSTASRRGRPEGKPPRPMNAWLIFRTAQLKLLKEEDPHGPRKSQGEMSKIIAERWRTVDSETRQEYETIAKERKEEFRLAYPDYRYGPHKPKGRSTKARVGLPDPSKAKRSSPRSHLSLAGTTAPSSIPRTSLDHPAEARSIRVVNAPDPADVTSALERATDSLPTPVSARSRWSNLQQLPRPPHLSHNTGNGASRNEFDSSRLHSSLPASAPAATSSFQSSLASLGASINSLAQPSLHFQQPGEDRFRRRVSIADHRQYYETELHTPDEYRTDATTSERSNHRDAPLRAPPDFPSSYQSHYPTPRGSFDSVGYDHASAGWPPRDTPRTSYHAPSADPPPDSAHGYPEEHQEAEVYQLGMASANARGPVEYGHLRQDLADGQRAYDRRHPQAQAPMQIQQSFPHYQSVPEDRQHTQVYGTDSVPTRWRLDLHDSV